MGLIHDFADEIDRRFDDSDASLCYAEWICQHTTMMGHAFSFAGYEFQRQIVNDLHPDLWCIKPSQIGLTEIQNRKYLAILARMQGMNGILTFPTDNMRDRNSTTRIQPMLKSEIIFNPEGFEKPTRSKALFQIGASFGYVTGSSEGDATSINASFLLHDELDLTDQAMIALFRSRLQGARDFSMIQRYSTPTYLGYGIDAGYAKSDKHEYMLKCGCGHWQVPVWHARFCHLPGAPRELPEDLADLTDEQIALIDFEHAEMRCERCRRPLDLGNPAVREWVPESPGARSRGYRVRPFSIAKIGPGFKLNTLDYIFGELSSRRALNDMKGFRNTVLGEAHNDANARLSEDAIRACMGGAAEEALSPGSKVFVGADVGTTCHVVVGGPDRVLGWYQVPRASLREFMVNLHARYEIVAGCIDMYPEPTLSESIRDIEGHVGTIMPVAYATTPVAPALDTKKNEFGEVTHHVANRTKAIDAVETLVRNRRITFTGYGAHQGLIVTHLRNMVRIEGVDTPPHWEKLDGPQTADHFFHALGYLQLAVRLKRGWDFQVEPAPMAPVFIRGATVMKPLSPIILPHTRNRSHRVGHLF